MLSSVQLLSRVWLFATPWIAAHQASLSITNPRSLLKLMPIESVMSPSHLILCHPLLLLLPIPPSIRVFSNESVLRIRWPKYWSFSFSISPSNEHPGLISFRMDWYNMLAFVIFSFKVSFHCIFIPLKEKVGKCKKLLWTLDILTVKSIITRSHSHSNSYSSSGRNGSDFSQFFFLSLLFDIVIDDRLSAPAVFLFRWMSLLHFIRSFQGGRIMECLWNLTDRILKSNLYCLRFFFKFGPFTQLFQLFPAIN